MARDVCETVIGEHTYRVTLLGAKAGTAMSVTLLKLLGPTVSSFVEGVVGGKHGGADSLAIGAADAVREITQRLTATELAQVMAELAKHTVVVLDAEREPQLSAVFDDHFAGRYDHLLAWLKFALEVNFRSFFVGSVGAGKLIERLMNLIASASPSPPASTGTSTASPPADTTAQA